MGRHNTFAELQRHYDRNEEARNQDTLQRARQLKVPIVATNGVSYATPAQRQLLDVFTCIRNHTTLGDAGRLLEINSERYAKTPAQMNQLFADLPEAIANTVEISSRLQFTPLQTYQSSFLADKELNVEIRLRLERAVQTLDEEIEKNLFMAGAIRLSAASQSKTRCVGPVKLHNT